MGIKTFSIFYYLVLLSFKTNMNAKTQKKLDTYKLRAYINQLGIKPGDFMFAEARENDYLNFNFDGFVFEKVIFQVISLDSNGLLRLRFVHFQNLYEPKTYQERIPDEYKTMKVGTDIAVSMTKSGSYYLRCYHSFGLRHVSLKDIKSTSLLSHIPKHPLQESKIFDKFIRLSAIDYIMKQ
jgi:hypothetical protein